MSPGFARLCRRALVAASLTVYAQAAILLDTGNLSFSATGTQFGRIARDGTSSTWGSVKAFPGVIGAPTERGYEFFTVNNGNLEFLQVSLDDPTASLFVTAYLDSFNPENSPPNFGLDVNYLGDPGLTQPFGVPSFFQIKAARNSTLVLVINEVNPGDGEGRPFNLIVERFYDSNYSETPEPGSFWLLASAAAVFGAIRMRSSRVAAQGQGEGGSSK